MRNDRLRQRQRPEGGKGKFYLTDEGEEEREGEKLKEELERW